MRMFLDRGVHVGLVLLLWMPLVVTPDTFHPYTVGKALYARAVIEVITALWVVLILVDPAYRPRRSWVLAAFGAYAAVALLSAFAGVSVAHSLWSDYYRMVGVWDLGHWLLLAVVAATVVRTPQAWRSVLSLNLAVALVLSLLAVAQTFQLPLIPFLRERCRVDATLGNPSYLAAILIVAILVAAGLLMHSFLQDDEAGGRAQRDGTARFGLIAQRGFWAVTAALALFALFETGTRGALAGLVAGTVGMPFGLAIFGNRAALRTVGVGAVGVLLGVTALFAVDRTVGLPTIRGCEHEVTSARIVGTTLAEGNIDTRLTLIEIGLRAFRERPLLGWGADNFSRAFDRLAKAPLYRQGVTGHDQAHNKPVEELATKGVLGGLTYGALWLALVRAIVHRRRPPREEALAYAVLGALGAYFVQDLFLFDTPTMLLQWTLLVAWVAAQERAPKAAGEEAVSRPLAGARRQRGRRRPIAVSTQASFQPWPHGAAVVGALSVLGLSLYLFSYRPYAAASQLHEALEGGGPMTERLALARGSFDAFPPLAALPRRTLFESLSSIWDSLSLEERQAAAEFVDLESARAFAAEPGDARLIASALPILQAVAPSREALERLDPWLQRLRELAPERLYTYQRLADQEYRKGHYREAIRLVEEFEAQAPWTAEHFAGLKRLAQEGLTAQGVSP